MTLTCITKLTIQRAESLPTSLPVKIIGTKHTGTEYFDRSAVRVVVTDADKYVIIIKVNKDNYYKLPGGGVEADEDHAQAAVREVAEETGCSVVTKGGHIAMSEEYRKDLHQISYCYLAQLISKSGRPELTEDEVEDGLVHEWAPVDKALEMMKAIQPTSELGHFIKERDIFLLAEAVKCIEA